ncbi:hypothetical protein FQZ97_564920 [compost metagenome]
MFNKDALQLILDHHAATAGKDLGTDTQAILLPESLRVASLEHLQPGRSRFRGLMSTSSLADFCAYVLARTEPGTQGFVDQDAMSCRAIFNLGDTDHPGHADDAASLQLKPTAAYQALQALAGRNLSQKELAEWMEDWNPYLTATVGETSMGMPQAIAAVRNITIKAASERNHQEGNFNASRSAMDTIEAQSQEQLPEALHFSLVPYEGLGQRTLTLRLSILTGGDKPSLKPRWVGEEIQREEIAQEFKRVLSEKLGDNAVLYLGNFNAGK